MIGSGLMKGRGEGLARSSRSHKTQAGEALEKHSRQRGKKQISVYPSPFFLSFFFSMIVL